MTGLRGVLERRVSSESWDDRLPCNTYVALAGLVGFGQATVSVS